jgi:hypothetical protein
MDTKGRVSPSPGFEEPDMLDSTEHDATPPPLWPFLLLTIAAGLWIDFGTLHRFISSDTIVPILVSVQRWTPYYWEQNRFGMLVPLLAIPFNNPLTNLLFQNGVTTVSGLAALFLIARYMIRDSTWPLVATTGAAGFLLFTPPGFRSFYFATAQPYNVALFLSFAGLLFAYPSFPGQSRVWHLGMALLLILLAHWVNAAVFFILGPLVVFRHLMSRLGPSARSDRCLLPGSARLSGDGGAVERFMKLKDSEFIIELVLIATGLAFGIFAQKIAPYQTTWTALAPIPQWPSRIGGIASDFWKVLAPHTWPRLLAVASGIGLLLLCIPHVRRRSGTAMRACLSLMLASIIYAAIMAAFFPPRYRYLLPAMFFVEIGLVAVAVAPLCSMLGRRARKALLIATAPGLLIATAISDGWPSSARVRSKIDRDLGTLTEDLLGAHCTHLAGDYWKVWTAVFHANLVLYEMGKDDKIWGLTHRSQPTRNLWSRVPEDKLRVAIPVGDDQAMSYLKQYGLPKMRLLEKRKTISVFVPDAPGMSVEKGAGVNDTTGFIPAKGEAPGVRH